MEYICVGAFDNREVFVPAARDFSETEVSMAKLNYQFARREKERVRKVRQQERLQRRGGRDTASAVNLPRIDASAAMSEPGQPGAPLQPESEK